MLLVYVWYKAYQNFKQKGNDWKKSKIHFPWKRDSWTLLTAIHPSQQKTLFLTVISLPVLSKKEHFHPCTRSSTQRFFLEVYSVLPKNVLSGSILNYIKICWRDWTQKYTVWNLDHERCSKYAHGPIKLLKHDPFLKYLKLIF